VTEYKSKLEQSYNKQMSFYDPLDIKLIGEENTCRAPFISDSDFVKIFYNDFNMKIIKDILGDYAILNLQNGVIVKPSKVHHQSFYHRDIIHQDFTSSKPISINLYYCLTNYHTDNGGLNFIPRSHKANAIPRKPINITPEVKAGSVILFDSMIYHKAGINNTKEDRVGINNMFSLPFIKQQIRYPHVVQRSNDASLNRLLGFESIEHLGVNEFRNYRLNRVRNAQ
jgi:ectoine hydroxylase-related dioxygenase (phytanoyl-CoA dioxygenase family)